MGNVGAMPRELEVLLIGNRELCARCELEAIFLLRIGDRQFADCWWHGQEIGDHLLADAPITLAPDYPDGRPRLLDA